MKAKNTLRYALLTTLISVAYILSAQSTFSKLYTSGYSLRDISYGLVISDDNITVNAKRSCLVEDNAYISCTTLHQFSYSGEILQTIDFDTLFPEGNNRFLQFEDKYYLTGHPHHVGQNRPTLLYVFDEDLNLLEQTTIANDIPGVHNNEGLVINEDAIYLYGYTVLPSGTQSVITITKLDRLTYDLIWEREVPTAHTTNRMYDLQFTPEGDLAVLRKRNNGVGDNSDPGIDLLLLDTMGNILQEYFVTKYRVDEFRGLHVDEQGRFYFGTLSFLGEILPESRGVINQLDASMDSILWIHRLPVNRFSLGRQYQVRDINQAANGDLLVCGTTWEFSGGNYQSNHQTYHGYIARISPQGEKRWVRVYQHPSYAQPTDSLGRYRPSFLNKVAETPTGEIVAAGHVWYDDRQVQAIPEAAAASHLWLLSVDADGCVAGEECKERVLLDSIGPPDLSLHIGARWTYEEVDNGYHVEPAVYEIVDTTVINDTTAFVVEKIEGAAEIGQLTYVHVRADSVYHYNAIEDRFELRFVYESPTTESDLLDFIVNYEAPWHGPCAPGPDLAQVYVDSLTLRNIDGYAFPIQNLRVANNGSFDHDLTSKVYTGIGYDKSFRLKLGYGLCDFPWYTTKLRCFEANGLTHNFVDYPCDSTWLISSTEDLNFDTPVEVFPNPSRGEIHLRGLPDRPVPYVVYDSQGRLMQNGMLQQNQLRLDTPGVYFLYLTVRDKVVVRKLVIF